MRQGGRCPSSPARLFRPARPDGIERETTSIALCVAAFNRDVVEAAAREREVTLTTYGRKSGKEHRVTIWVVTDGAHPYISSGQGVRRQWPQNLMARGEGV